MITYRIHLIRTGSTSANPWRRYVGQSDLPLCEKGVQELCQLHREFRYPPAEVCFTSPLQRCKHTADILYPDTFTLPLEGLKDMNLGEFEGCTFGELQENPEFQAWLKNSFENTPPGGEPTQDFTRRVVATLQDIFRYMMDNKLTSAAVITHGGVIMTLLAAVGLPKLALHQWTVGNGAGYTLLMTPQLWLQSGAAEVFTHLPEPKTEDDMEMYGLYFNDKEPAEK